MSDLHVYEIDGREWVVAENPTDALAVAREFIGDQRAYDDSYADQVPDGGTLRFWCHEDGTICEHGDAGGSVKPIPVATLIAMGRCRLGGTEY